MTGDRDIVVKVYLSGADWLGLKDLAESKGLSQSSFLRLLLRHAIEHHARHQFAKQADELARAETDLE